MNPLWLLALLFVKNLGRSPGWPPAGHPPPMRPLLITKHGVTPLDAANHMPAAAPPAETPAHAAAQALYAYLTGPTPDWGFPHRPSAAVKQAQSAMGVPADGIYGAHTRARCAELLGHPCPGRPSAASAAKSTALHAAKGLTARMIPRIP
jgi:peptidoglycan hydrolase-like protein with peptidoglycan-binding domain